MRKVGGAGGGSQFDYQYYTPLYEKGIKKIENKSMETTIVYRVWKIPVLFNIRNKSVTKGKSAMIFLCLRFIAFFPF